MGIAWGSLFLVFVVSLAVGVALRRVRAGRAVGPAARPRGRPARRASTMSSGTGTAIAGLCLLAAAAIVAYGLYIIIA